MKLNRLTALALTLLIGVSACLCVNAQTRKQYRTFGVAFYNLENLFDTINNYYCPLNHKKASPTS